MNRFIFVTHLFSIVPYRFMESELELHESVQELHALATVPDLYVLAVDLNLLSILLGCLSHENADISCAVLDVLQELTDVDTVNEAEEATGVLIDNLIDLQSVGLLTQNLDRLDEANKDEADGVHNTLAIFENLFELRSELCSMAGKNVSIKLNSEKQKHNQIAHCPEILAFVP